MQNKYDKQGFAISGFIVVLIDLIILLAALYSTILANSETFGVILLVIFSLSASGFMIIQPNESKVLVFFGSYAGTVSKSGFFWTNPFVNKHKVSLRVHNFSTEKIKVNDKDGNPIEIASVISWRVFNPAASVFDVEKYDIYVSVQSETAVRTIATTYPYDSHQDDLPMMGHEQEPTHQEPVISLRENSDKISQELKQELGDRLEIAGVEILEARISHLAYAPEIAQAMLRRQQAQAIIMARKKIVDGAVGMVEMALNYLKKNNVVELDEEKKAAMVNNLLVTLTADRETQPVINTGTLYS